MKKIRGKSYPEQGFTLVELLLVLALVGTVLAIGYQAFFSANRSWQANEAINPHISKAKTVMSLLGNEIRGAEKPSETERAVLVPDAEGAYAAGQRLFIYRYDDSRDEWNKIFYRIHNHELQRSLVASDDPDDIIDESFPTNNWETIASGISDPQVFYDNTNGTGDQRLIEIVLSIADTAQSAKPRFQPFTVSSSYLSRSREVGSVSGAPVAGPGGETTVPVFSVTLDITSREIDEGDSFTLTAKVHPSNASNQSVSWSSSKSSVATVSGSGLTATITGVSKGKTDIVVTTSDGGKTAKCVVEVVNPGC